ncbi:amino acid deaminase [Microbacterium amylolyticum]|uniref:Amino acid deaminase n=1 Tax=Microbacterium amylolyticum TaxID=936337 RepID=A0ABS4ZJC6_9MICO|nr:amino acid deaminase [Microbacterium amylolyticum]MBP2437379.1 hypothetical protein [Microbacterium amylolyticum]
MVIPTLEAVLPCVRADARAGRFSVWGWSTIIDEEVGEPVIPRELFARLHAAAGIETVFPIGNAGLLHVYGYLFSTVQTPYGYKSDRWNDGHLARTLQYAESEFRLDGSFDATPLERVSNAAMPLLLVPPAGSTVIDQRALGVRTRTVITPPVADGSGVLVYGVADDHDGLRLVTFFPVADARAFANEATAEAPKLRWNAALKPSPRDHVSAD